MLAKEKFYNFYFKNEKTFRNLGFGFVVLQFKELK